MEDSLVENKVNFLVVFWGSLLERLVDGLFILVGGKLIDYCKMVEGVMKMI